MSPEHDSSTTPPRARRRSVQPPLHPGLGRRRVRALRELAQREGRMAQPELCGFAHRVGETWQGAVCPQPPSGLELPLRGSSSAHEIRVVGVGEAVRLPTQLGDDRALLQGEHRLDRTRGGEECLDGIPALRVGNRVARPLEDAEPDALCGGDDPQERGRRRASRCGARDAQLRPSESVPPPRKAPRRYAPRQQLAGDDAAWRTSRAAVPRVSRIPASATTASARSSPSTWSWYRVSRPNA